MTKIEKPLLRGWHDTGERKQKHAAVTRNSVRSSVYDNLMGKSTRIVFSNSMFSFPTAANVLAPEGGGKSTRFRSLLRECAKKERAKGERERERVERNKKKWEGTGVSRGAFLTARGLWLPGRYLAKDSRARETSQTYKAPSALVRLYEAPPFAHVSTIRTDEHDPPLFLSHEPNVRLHPSTKWSLREPRNALSRSSYVITSRSRASGSLSRVSLS